MGNWSECGRVRLRGGSEEVLRFWGFRVDRSDSDRDAVLAVVFLPPFEPAVHRQRSCSYPTGAVEGNQRLVSESTE
eukprot:3272107-Alexandrium_andersonii.AAC.1